MISQVVGGTRAGGTHAVPWVTSVNPGACTKRLGRAVRRVPPPFDPTTLKRSRRSQSEETLYMSVTERKPGWVLKNACLPLFRAVESVCERKPVCAFPERKVHVNFGKESLFAQEKPSELVRGALF
jgi:hypothetical protein